MADQQNQQPPAPVIPKPLHPVYTVTNIQNKVRILDGDKVTYSDWVKLFKLHALGYDVLPHIDGTGPPDKSDPSYEAWCKIDAIVLQWIYGTLSDSYFKRVSDTGCTAQQAWDRLYTVFLNNKNARAATLEHAFTTTTMASCSSLNEYFQRMKDLAEQLTDVDHPVSESRLVLQMVMGLPQEYDTVASFIIQAEKTWDDAREMIEREQRRIAARQTALAAHGPPPSNPPNTNTTPPPPQSYHPAQTYDNRNQTRGRGRGRSSYRGRGRGRYSYNQNTYYPSNSNPNPSQTHPQTYGLPAYQPNTWYASPPPCPYPSQSPWQPTWYRPTTASPSQQPAPNQQPPPGFGLTTPNNPYPYPPYNQPIHQPNNQPVYPSPPNVDPMQPTELGAALSALTLSQPIPQWNMDTGASSHITSDQGSQDWTTSFAP